MRSGFSQQLELESMPIEELKIPVQKKRSNHIADILLALQALYTHRVLSPQVDRLLSNSLKTKHTSGKGCHGMSLWELFVLAQLRLCLNISYDQVMDLANHHILVRGVLGLTLRDGRDSRKVFSRSSIYDNLQLIDETTLSSINDLVITLGHEVFRVNKKKDNAALSLKTDSFVVETDTHFPTDYRTIYESGRKCLELVAKLNEELSITGWRQWKDSRQQLKSSYRDFGKITSSGGKNKEARVEKSCKNLLLKANRLALKVGNYINEVFPIIPIEQFGLLVELEWFHRMLLKHSDQLERRILKAEAIAHDEKIFSIFLPFTEWINKGKRNVEIGKKMFVTTDQFNLIVHYSIGDNLQDKDAILPIMDDILAKYSVKTWSTDKGFSSQQNKEIIGLCYPDIKMMMPKKGKKNRTEILEEKSKEFVKLRNQHSAIESNINELEHRGMNRCPDRSRIAFNKYVGLSVIAYNLHKIGRKLSNQVAISQQQAKEKASKVRAAA